jgi:hypothetical protein
MRASRLVLVALATIIAPLSACLAAPFGDSAADSLARADTNHDGFISKAEFIANRALQFDQLDRAKRGYVPVDAVPSFLASSGRGAALSALLRSADRDHDGRVTRAVLAAAPTPTFDRADRDHNGLLDADEQAYFVRLVERER